jgi:hypothetical protein
LAQRYGSIQKKANVAELAERLKVSNDATENDEEWPEEVYWPEELQKMINNTAAGSWGACVRARAKVEEKPADARFAARAPRELKFGSSNVRRGRAAWFS